ncbi:hypothetical protein FOL47_009970 [Perkinsus chesapeaki]|uniref:Uncharacterized protein n=1 Tax=Perkinsus chesapeaki TaxID=330153 RepID=A0A7J6L5L1_PERCH|nr:hypothetical protein FOL47_009970 [Perkinsus chesapeaki]
MSRGNKHTDDDRGDASTFEYDSVVYPRDSCSSSTVAAAAPEMAGRRTPLDSLLKDASQVTGCFCLEEFRFIHTTVRHASVWVAAQGLLVLLLMVLHFHTLQPHISEVGSVLDMFCNDTHLWDGDPICLVEANERSSGEDWVIGHDEVLEFDVASNPPTVLIGVRPMGRCKNSARWRLRIFDETRKMEEQHTGAGPRSFVVSSRHDGLMLSSNKWKLEFSLSNGIRQFGQDELCEVEIFAVDNQQPHLPRIHEKFSGSDGQCEFAGTWLRLTDRHDLSWMQFASKGVTNFLWLSCLLVAAVGYLVHRYGLRNPRAQVDHFPAVVLLKSFLVDFFLQVFVLMYIYLWYGRNGLQCQMCLFHPDHCGGFDTDPMHGALRYVIITIVLSALMPQLLVRQKAFLNRDARYVGMGDEIDHFCMGGFTRLGLASLLLLPFTTGFLFLGPLVLVRGSGVSSSLYMLLAIPVVIGWSLLLCVPTLALCDDVDDYDYPPVVDASFKDCIGFLQFVKPYTPHSVVLMKNTHNPGQIDVITPQKRWVITDGPKHTSSSAADLSKPLKVGLRVGAPAPGHKASVDHMLEYAVYGPHLIGRYFPRGAPDGGGLYCIAPSAVKANMHWGHSFHYTTLANDAGYQPDKHEMWQFMTVDEQ